MIALHWLRGAKPSIAVLLFGLSSVAFVSSALIIGFLIRSANANANVLAAATIGGAVDRERSRISNETYINAHWDDAATHVYGIMDARWIHSNYGTPIARNYIIDAKGRTLYGHLPGGRVPPLSRMISAAALKTLLARVPATELAVRKRNDATVLLTRFGGTPALVGFSPIVRESGSAPLDRASYRIFVDIRLIDDTILQEWASGFGIPDLRWTSGAAAGSVASTDLLDWTRRPVGTVAWRRLTPGLDAFGAILPVVLCCIALFLILSATLIRRVLRLNLDLQDKSRTAERAAAEEQSARLAAERALTDMHRAQQESEHQVQRRIQAEVRHRAEMTAASSAIADQLQQTIGALIGNLRTSANELDVSADRTLATIVDQQQQAETAQSISTQTSAMTGAMLATLRTVATSVDVVSGKARQSAEMMIEAARHSATAQRANETLTHSVAAIQEASEHINGISQATKLLALNATIEAARAGDMGRGFGVVAQEVKSFSQQAATTTRTIADRVHDISMATNSAVSVGAALGDALASVTASATQTIEATEQQHHTNAQLHKAIVGIETSTRTAREALHSLGGLFDQTATVAHQTRIISTDMRTRTEALQAECDRIVAMLRGTVKAAA